MMQGPPIFAPPPQGLPQQGQQQSQQQQSPQQPSGSPQGGGIQDGTGEGGRTAGRRGGGKEAASVPFAEPDISASWKEALSERHGCVLLVQVSVVLRCNCLIGTALMFMCQRYFKSDESVSMISRSMWIQTHAPLTSLLLYLEFMATCIVSRFVPSLSCVLIIHGIL